MVHTKVEKVFTVSRFSLEGISPRPNHPQCIILAQLSGRSTCCNFVVLAECTWQPSPVQQTVTILVPPCSQRCLLSGVEWEAVRQLLWETSSLSQMTEMKTYRLWPNGESSYMPREPQKGNVGDDRLWC